MNTKSNTPLLLVLGIFLVCALSVGAYMLATKGNTTAPVTVTTEQSTGLENTPAPTLSPSDDVSDIQKDFDETQVGSEDSFTDVQNDINGL